MTQAKADILEFKTFELDRFWPEATPQVFSLGVGFFDFQFFGYRARLHGVDCQILAWMHYFRGLVTRWETTSRASSASSSSPASHLLPRHL